MASLKDLFGFNRVREESAVDFTAEDVRENKGDFAVPLFNTDTGETTRFLYFESAAVFANEIKFSMMRSNEEAFDLSGMDLRDIDFSHTQELYGARFNGSDLRGAKLAHCDLTGSSFRRAKLQHSDISESIIRYSDFSDADLSNAELYVTKANQAVFSGCKFVNAQLGGMIAPQANFMQADLTGAGTNDMDIKGANLHFAKITRAQLAACKNADKAQYMTASYLMRKAGRKRGPKPS